MKGYQIPNTDFTSHLTKNLIYNYQTYRTLIHFIYLKKDFYFVNNNEVIAAEKSDILESGKVVYKVANLQFNLNDWKVVWNIVSKNNVFIYHVGKVLATSDSEDIVELLNSIVPCGITQYMGDAMLFAESLKKCYNGLSHKIKVGQLVQKYEEDYEIINNWLKNFQKDGPEKFTIPSVIFGLAQAFTDAESPEYANNLTDIILNSDINYLMRPYIWATVIEVFYNADIQLPIYETHGALEKFRVNHRKIPEIYPQKRNLQIDKKFVQSTENGKYKDPTKFERSTSGSGKTQKFTLEDHTSNINMNPDELISGVSEQEKIDKDIESNQNESKIKEKEPNLIEQYIGMSMDKLPRVTLSIPLIPGTAIKGLQFEFKCSVKSFHIDQNYEFGSPKSENNSNSPIGNLFTESPDTYQNNNDGFKEGAHTNGDHMNSKMRFSPKQGLTRNEKKKTRSCKSDQKLDEASQKKCMRYA